LPCGSNPHLFFSSGVVISKLVSQYEVDGAVPFFFSHFSFPSFELRPFDPSSSARLGFPTTSQLELHPPVFLGFSFSESLRRFILNYPFSFSFPPLRWEIESLVNVTRFVFPVARDSAGKQLGLEPVATRFHIEAEIFRLGRLSFSDRKGEGINGH